MHIGDVSKGGTQASRRSPEGSNETSTSKLWLLAGREGSKETSTSKLQLLADRVGSEETSTSKLWLLAAEKAPRRKALANFSFWLIG